MNASDVLIETIMEWGVDVVFGLPGDGINGVMEALRVRQEKIRFVQVRHEETAAFMACAYAKYTGKLGCCVATTGPGGIHLLNGLYDAKLDQAPVLAITGATYSDLKGSNFQQEVDLVKVFEDVAVYNECVISPEQVHMLANEACRRALNHRGVAHITIPIDYQEKEVKEKTTMHKQPGHTNAVWAPPKAVPERYLLEQAANLLNAATDPVILIGQGARAAAADVLELAEKLGAPIVKALLGKDVIPDENPLTTGGLGLLGTAPSQEAMENCKTLIMIGTSFPYIEYLPKVGAAKCLQIDDKPDRIGLRYPVDVGLVGDARRTLEALLPLVDTKEDRAFLEKAQEGMQKWREMLGKSSDPDAVPIKPMLVSTTLSELIDNDAIVSGDSGSITSLIARGLQIRGNQKFSLSGSLATMAPGLPYAMAAKIAFPQRQSVAFVGDGGFTMLMGDFVTAVKYKLPIVVVIVKNDTLAQIKWEQLVFLGNPEYGCELQPIDFSKFAEACGGLGFKVTQPGELRKTLQTALACGRPCIVEVAVDPYDPPMPPKVSAKQAAHFGQALAKGQPDRGKIALTIFRNKLNELT